MEVYPGDNVIWQDDSARICRCKAAITACSEVFKKCVPHEIQGAKMTYVWPIGNVWSIITNDLMKYELRNKDSSSIGKRLQKFWETLTMTENSEKYDVTSSWKFPGCDWKRWSSDILGWLLITVDTLWVNCVTISMHFIIKLSLKYDNRIINYPQQVFLPHPLCVSQQSHQW